MKSVTDINDISAQGKIILSITQRFIYMK